MSANSSNSSAGGNTKSPAQSSAKKLWCFTLNNWTQVEYDNIKDLFKGDSSNIYIIGKEVGEEGTPHLQMFCNFKTKIRFTALKKICNRLHIEPSRGSQIDNLKYCAKEGNYITNGRVPRPLVLMEYKFLRNEQKIIADKFKELEHPLWGRNVYWFWEPKGNWGKSVTCKYMIDCMDAFVVSGANNDIICGINRYVEEFDECPPIIIFDIPRCNDGNISYQAIEKMKSGFFFSPKYESGMRRFNIPHVIVFANCKPDQEALSPDRWIIERLDKEVDSSSSSEEE